MLRKTLRHLRNTRELRAGILDLAARLAVRESSGQLSLPDPIVSEAAIREEWDRLMPALTPRVRSRMSLVIGHDGGDPAATPTRGMLPGQLALDRPNYRFEVLRLLLGASLERRGPQPQAGIGAHFTGTQVGLVGALGVSPTPVRSALVALRDAGLIRSLTRLEIAPAAISMEQLSRIGALPQTLRFRFERGARIKAPAELVKRAEPLLGPKGPKSWKPFSLGGVPVAQGDVRALDLVGVPRLDLVAHIPRGTRQFDAGTLRVLDDGLEPEPNVLAPAPVVVTLIRAGTRFDRTTGIGQVRRAHACDVFLGLLDMGLREQALHYASAVRS